MIPLSQEPHLEITETLLWATPMWRWLMMAPFKSSTYRSPMKATTCVRLTMALALACLLSSMCASKVSGILLWCVCVCVCPSGCKMYGVYDSISADLEFFFFLCVFRGARPRAKKNSNNKKRNPPRCQSLKRFYRS